LVGLSGQTGRDRHPVGTTRLTKADVHVSASILGLVARNLLTLSIFGSCAPRLLDSDAAERKVDMFVTKKDGRMSHILTIGAARLGPIQRSGDRASVVQRMLDLRD
jgi:hypothetical protein